LLNARLGCAVVAFDYAHLHLPPTRCTVAVAAFALVWFVCYGTLPVLFPAALYLVPVGSAAPYYYLPIPAYHACCYTMPLPAACCTLHTYHYLPTVLHCTYLERSRYCITICVTAAFGSATARSAAAGSLDLLLVRRCGFAFRFVLGSFFPFCAHYPFICGPAMLRFCSRRLLRCAFRVHATYHHHLLHTYLPATYHTAISDVRSLDLPDVPLFGCYVGWNRADSVRCSLTVVRLAGGRCASGDAQKLLQWC